MAKQDKSGRIRIVRLSETFISGSESATDMLLRTYPGNGSSFVVIYLKLCGIASDDGIIRESEAKITRSLDLFADHDIREAVKALEDLNLISRTEDGFLLINESVDVLASETKYARQKRRQRREVDNVHQKSGQCPPTKVDNVHQKSGQCPPLEHSSNNNINIYTNKNNCVCINKYNNKNKKDTHTEEPKKEAYGKHSNVFLSATDIEELRNELPDTWAQMIEKLSDGKVTYGYTYNNDKMAILRWAENDRKREEEKRLHDGKEKRSGNAFHNFQQRTYDADAFAKKLLGFA